MDDLLNLDLLRLVAIVLRTSVVYFVLLIGLRLAGKRELGQMNVFDLLVVLIISNAVQNAMVGSDVSLTGGLLAAITLLTINHIVSLVGRRVPRIGRELVGTPTLLVHDGEFITQNLDREDISPDEVMQALREHGVEDLDVVQLAVLEVDGTISVVPSDAPSSRTRRRLRGRKPIG
ncbi:MAG TPA: YetF domain-containing protein [Chloroflexota bacterium]|jgi:uncharacterized membrane protein YcaP (DUF421 family)